MTPVERVLQIARDEIGYLEKRSNSQLDDKTANAGSNNYTKYARDLDKIGFYNAPKNGYEWCDMFCDWVFVKAFGKDMALKITGQKLGGLGAGCTFSAKYYANIARFYKSGPQPGDQIFFTNNAGKDSCHTGLVEKVESGIVTTIEGNTSGASGVIPNGGGVCRKKYSIGDPNIYGYGRPAYSVIPNEEEDEEMSQEKFNELMDNYLAGIAEKEPSSWSQADREWAVNTGLINGDGNGRMRWRSGVTREEIAALLHRLSEKLVTPN